MSEVCIYVFCSGNNSVEFLQLSRQRFLDRFKNREENFVDKLENDLFPDLCSMRDHAQKSHLQAMKWGLRLPRWNFGKVHSNFIEETIDNVAFRSHSRAVSELKLYFGREEVLSKSKSKAARRIIKESSRPLPMAQPQQFQGES